MHVLSIPKEVAGKLSCSFDYEAITRTEQKKHSINWYVWNKTDIVDKKSAGNILLLKPFCLGFAFIFTLPGWLISQHRSSKGPWILWNHNRVLFWDKITKVSFWWGAEIRHNVKSWLLWNLLKQNTSQSPEGKYILSNSNINSSPLFVQFN